MSQNSRYFVLDPSVFVSVRKIEELLRVLSSLAQPRIDSMGKTSVIIPGDLYNVLYFAVKGKKLEEHDIKVAKEIFSQWLPFYDAYHVELILRQLFTDDKYLEALKRLFESFEPTSAKEYMADQDSIGERTLHFSDVVERLGEIIGRLVFESLALSHKLKGMIISFGQRLATMIRKLKMTVLTVHSVFKEKIKQHAKIRSMLRISLYVISTESLRKLTSDLQISGLNLDLAIDITGLGVFIVADG